MKEVFNSIKEIFGAFNADMISTLKLSLPSDIKADSIVLVKNKKILEDLKTSFEDQKNVFLLITEELFEREKDYFLGLEKKIRFLGLVSNFDKFLCNISKYFYDLKLAGVQNLVDGRQVGENKIDPSAEISQGVFIGENVTIEKNVKIYPGCVLSSNIHIKENTILYPNVTVYSFSEIGKDCRIHAGTVIGSDGFGYNFLDGKHEKIWHYGGVKIEDEVEIGSNCTVDSGTFVPTRIGHGTKIDNLVQVAHNVDLGKSVILCGNAGVAGSTKLGDYTVVGGAVAVGPGLKLGVACKVAGGAMVTKSWDDHSEIGGYPARDMREWKRSIVRINRLGRNS